MKYLITLLLALTSCKNEPIKTYTLKVYFQDGTIDTLNIRGNYEIDKQGSLRSLRFGYYGTVATKFKYVKEIQ